MLNSPNSVPFYTFSLRWESAFFGEKAISWQNNWFWFHSFLCQCSFFHEAPECFELHCEKKKKKIQEIDSTHLEAPQPSLKIRHQKQSRSHRRKGVLPPRSAQGHCHHCHEQTNLSLSGNLGQPDVSPSAQYPPTHLFFRSLLNTYRRFPDTDYTIIKVVMG